MAAAMDDNSGERIESAGGEGETAGSAGNAAARILSEIFVSDLTVARATCANCGINRPLGALMVYAHGMGTIMRCPSCNAAILRVARTRTHLQLDLTGAS